MISFTDCDKSPSGEHSWCECNGERCNCGKTICTYCDAIRDLAAEERHENSKSSELTSLRAQVATLTAERDRAERVLDAILESFIPEFIGKNGKGALFYIYDSNIVPIEETEFGNDGSDWAWLRSRVEGEG